MRYFFLQGCGFEIFMYRFFLLVLFLVFFVTSGCNSFGERHVKIRNEFAQGHIDKASIDISRAIRKSSYKDIDLLKLNNAIIELCSGRPRAAESLLREVRDKFDRLERENAANAVRDAASLLTDDNARAYYGEDYEKVLIRVFLAISNLMHDGSDAYSYALQINDKQNKIIEKRKKEIAEFNINDPDLLKRVAANYHDVAIGAYLEGLIHEETKRNYNEAARAYARAGCKLDAERAKNGLHSKSGNGVVYVIGLIDDGPYKVQRNCEALRDVQIMTTAILSHVSRTAIIPDFAPIMIPVIVQNTYYETSFRVIVGNKKVDSKTITDVGDIAKSQFDANFPMLVARAIVRRAVKKGAVYGMKEAVDANKWVGLAMEIGGMMWESLETADTRCWNLLPAKICICRVELPAGEHEIEIAPSVSSSYKHFLSKENVAMSALANPHIPKKVKVQDGRNTYVLVNLINGKLIGKITTNNEDVE
jgi:hypothetical protein